AGGRRTYRTQRSTAGRVPAAECCTADRFDRAGTVALAAAPASAGWRLTRCGDYRPGWCGSGSPGDCGDHRLGPVDGPSLSCVGPRRVAGVLYAPTEKPAVAGRPPA